jgi:hypothetical protein
VGSAKGQWRIRVIRNLLLGRVYLANDDLGEHADHQTFLSLPSWEIVPGLHDTAQTVQTRSGSVGREGPGTVAQGHRRAKGKAWEDLSSARARKARDHSDNEALPRARLFARRRGRRVPFARRRDSPRPGSWHVLPEMQHTVRFVPGLKGTMSEAELPSLKQRMHQGRLSKAKPGRLAVCLAGRLPLEPDGRDSVGPR